MKKILGLLLVSSSIFSMQLDLIKQKKLPSTSQYISSNMGDVKKVRINPSSVFVPSTLGSVELYHGKKGFSVRQDNKKHLIQKCFTDQMMRNITKEQLHAFLQAGYLSLNQMNDGTFSLQAKGRIAGGGPILGKIMYWTTKGICYTVIATGIGALVVSGGRIALKIGGGEERKAKKIADATYRAVETARQSAKFDKNATQTVQYVAGTMFAYNAANTTMITIAGEKIIPAAIVGSSGIAGCLTGSGLLAITLINEGYAPACAEVTVAAVAATTGSAVSPYGLMATIEWLSLAAGVFGGMMPTP